MAIDIDVGKDQFGRKADKTHDGVGMLDEVERDVKKIVKGSTSYPVYTHYIVLFYNCSFSPSYKCCHICYLQNVCVCPILPALKRDSSVISLSIQAHPRC